MVRPREKENMTTEIRRTIVGKAGFFPCKAIRNTVLSLFIKIQWSEIVTDAELTGDRVYCMIARSCAPCPWKQLLSKIHQKKVRCIVIYEIRYFCKYCTDLLQD